MQTIVPRGFYSRKSRIVARGLIGKILVRNLGHGVSLKGIIVETEAYGGVRDPASHAYRGQTKRNEAMFGDAGFTYVYFTYGFHHCLNLVTGKKGEAQAVLLRALEPIEGLDTMRDLRKGVRDIELTNGPGKICQAMNIDLSLNKIDVTDGESAIYLEENISNQDKKKYRTVASGPRIGVTFARSRRWRFYVATSPYVSHRRKLNLPIK